MCRWGGDGAGEGKTADEVRADGGRGRVTKSTNARALCVGQAFRSGAFFLFPVMQD